MHVMGKTTSEIAAAYGGSRSAMSWLMFRARQKLAWFQPLPTCPFCQRPIRPNEGTDDHVLPQGLGAFTAAPTVRTHRRCNNERGKELEAAVLHQSYYTGLRGALTIRSRQSKRTWKDPLEAARQRSGERFTDVIVGWHGQEVSAASMTPQGQLVLPPMLVVEAQDGVEEPGQPISGLSAVEVGKKLNDMLHDLRGRGVRAGVRAYHDDQEFVRQALTHVDAEFRRDEVGVENGGQPQLLTCKMTGYFAEVHLRAHGFWLLKAMTNGGVHPKYLVHLARYVRTGKLHAADCFSTLDKIGEARSERPMDQGLYAHRIEWNVEQSHATGGVMLFGIGNAGLVARFRFALPQNVKEILIPGQGAVIAGYTSGGRPGQGWIEMLKDQRVVSTSRPSADPETRAPARGGKAAHPPGRTDRNPASSATTRP